MGHGKLRKFEENKSFRCLLQPDSSEVLDLASGRGLVLRDHPVKGRWNGDVFAAMRPVVLELGCGRGEYTIDLAKRDPSRNYVGVDIKGARLWRGARQATQEQMGNVAFLRTRIEFIEAFFAPGEVSEIWLTFSDPQLRSENKRLTCPMFLERYRKFLRPGGVVHLKTDSRFLHEYTKSVAEANGLRILASTADLYATPADELYSLAPDAEVNADAVSAIYEVRTYYEKMFMRQGYKITYLSFRIDKDGEYVSPSDFDADYWRSAEGPRKFFRLPDE